MPALTIARLTLREAVRKRLLLAVAILTLLTIVLTGWGFSRLNSATGPHGQPISPLELQTSEAALVVLLAWMFSFVLALGAAFLAAPSIAADIESGLLLALLPRPIRRSDVLLGKWLGLALLLAAYAGITGAVELTVIDAVIGYQPPHGLLALLYLIGQSWVMLSLALLCSTRFSPITGGIIGVILFGLAWIAGILGAIGDAFNNASLRAVTGVFAYLLPTDGLWRGAVYNLEPPFVIVASHGLARQAPFSVTAPPSSSTSAWAVCWVVAVLALSAASFARRDL